MRTIARPLVRQFTTEPRTVIKKQDGTLWKDPEVQRKFFDDAGQALRVRTLSDWYRFSLNDVNEVGGAALLTHHFNNSLSRALATVYPDHEWLPWKFTKTSQAFWVVADQQRAFLNWCEKQLGITEPRGWYTVRQTQLHQLGGTKLIIMHGGSLIRVLQSVYPEHEWQEWRFTKVPTGFWNSDENRRRYMTWLGQELGISSVSGWYNITAKDVMAKGGSRLLLKFENNIPKLISTVFSEHEWLEWEFKSVSRGWWRLHHNRKIYVDWVGQQLGVKQLDDWETKTKEDFNKVGGGSMLSSIYAGSLTAALRDIYPEHDWKREVLAVSPPV